MIKLDGSALAKQIRKQLKLQVADLEIKPKLVVCLVGSDPASEVYVRNKQKACEKVGMESELVRFNDDVKALELIDKIAELNSDPKVTGILVQLPLPGHIDSFDILDSIHPSKDVDCLTPYNQGLMNLGIEFIRPCTPSGIIDLLKANQISIKGKNAVVIGRSNIVGKPMAQMLLEEDASVSILHSKTDDIKSYTQKADIIVAAAGVPSLLDESYISKDTVLVDVGIHRQEDGLVGDVDADSVSEKALALSPVPGGVGPMTIASLLKNTLSLYYYQHPELEMPDEF